MCEQPGRLADWVEEIMQRHKDRVLRTAIAIMGNMADAEDVFQDAFLQLFVKQPQLSSPEHEAAWLVRVTANLCKSRLRSYRRRPVQPLLETHPAQTGEQHDLAEIIAALPPKYKLAIHLFYYEGYSIQEIAEMTGQKYSTVGNHLSRARVMLKKFLEDG